MKLKAFEEICDRRCPVTADEFLELAKQWLGKPTDLTQQGDAMELVWRHRRQVVAWVILRKNTITGQWYPVIGGR